MSADLSWRCEAHDITTTGDCSRCDDELIALSDGPTCRSCGMGFTDGEEVYASDWTVIESDGTRMETRYQHITCGDAA